MSTVNQKTLSSYEAHSQAYISNTPSEVCDGLKDWIDESVSGLSLTAKILEIGSGDGRDADYIEQQGFDVECTDAAQAFVSVLLDRGFNARLHNAILDPISGSYDLVYANAVLLHFTHEEATLVTSKVITALKNRGRFAFSLKKGRGEKWSTDKMNAPRYYYYWSKKEVEKLLKNTGFSRWTINEDGSGRGGTEEWMQIIAYK